MDSYGYIKKASEMAGVIEQVNAISQYDLTNIFIDDSVTSAEFQVLHERLQKGDSLVITNLAIFEQSLRQLECLFLKLQELDIRLIVINEGIDTKEEAYSQYFSIMLGLLQMEKDVNRRLAIKRIARIRENGKIIGRPSLDQKVVEQIVYLRKRHKKSIRQIARECEVSVGTVYKYVSQNEELDTLALKL